MENGITPRDLNQIWMRLYLISHQPKSWFESLQWNHAEPKKNLYISLHKQPLHIIHHKDSLLSEILYSQRMSYWLVSLVFLILSYTSSQRQYCARIWKPKINVDIHNRRIVYYLNISPLNFKLVTIYFLLSFTGTKITIRKLDVSENYFYFCFCNIYV